MVRHRIETHAHTSLVSPCGHLSPVKLARAYAKAGYFGIIVTDHLSHSLPIFREFDTWPEQVEAFFAGFRGVRDSAASFDLRVFPGFELTFADYPGRDFLVYGIDEEMLTAMPDLCVMDPTSFKNLAAEAGALVFQAHPYRNNEPVHHSLIDGLEVFNCNPRHDSRNDLAAEFAAEHGLLASSGSDAHRREDVARGGISLSEMPATIHELLRFWRNSPEEIDLLQPSTLYS